MRDMVLAAAQRALHPGVHNVKGQRCMYTYGWVQRRRRVPGFVAHTRYIFANCARALQRQGAAIDGDYIAVVVQACDVYLDTLK